MAVTPNVFEFFNPRDIGGDAYHWLNKRPRSVEELFSYTHLILAHFTSSHFLESIRERGLIPDFFKERAIDDGVPSDHVSVYLSTHYERFYLQRATKHYGGKGIIVVVRLELTALAPDESALSDIERATLPADMQLYHSLCFGACKHTGVISTDEIIGIYSTAGQLLRPTSRRS